MLSREKSQRERTNKVAAIVLITRPLHSCCVLLVRVPRFCPPPQGEGVTGGKQEHQVGGCRGSSLKDASHKRGQGFVFVLIPVPLRSSPTPQLPVLPSVLWAKTAVPLPCWQIRKLRLEGLSDIPPKVASPQGARSTVSENSPDRPSAQSTSTGPTQHGMKGDSDSAPGGEGHSTSGLGRGQAGPWHRPGL